MEAKNVNIAKEEENDVVKDITSPGNGVKNEQTRRGSACKQLRPFPTFVKSDSQGSDHGAADRHYIVKVIQGDTINNKLTISRKT